MKILEDIGHVLIGLIPGWGVLREWRQLPPENDANPVVYIDPEIAGKDWDWLKAWLGPGYGGVPYWSSVRVADIFRDLAGYAVGDVIRTAILIGLLIWRW